MLNKVLKPEHKGIFIKKSKTSIICQRCVDVTLIPYRTIDGHLQQWMYHRIPQNSIIHMCPMQRKFFLRFIIEYCNYLYKLVIIKNIPPKM